MTLPTIQQDVWAKATQQDIVTALSRIGLLPSRPVEPGTEDVARDAMYRALRGVTKFGLNEAIDAVLQGKLGHGFFPSPPELRMQCDKAMKHHEEERNRIARQERIQRERIPPRVEPSPEQKARVAKIMADFHASYEAAKQQDIEAERAEIRKRNGMTPEALASIPDAPIGSWEKPQLKKPAE